MLAAATTTPELILHPDEAKGMAVAIQNVARDYDMFEASQTAVDSVALILCLSAVYTPRLIVIKKRQDAEERRKQSRPYDIKCSRDSRCRTKVPGNLHRGAEDPHAQMDNGSSNVLLAA
jgi:hypothetical protein